MLRQITGQTAQEGPPPLPIVNQDSINQIAAAKMEPEANIDKNTENTVEEVKKPLVDKQNWVAVKGNDSASSSRYLFVFSSFSTIYQ